MTTIRKVLCATDLSPASVPAWEHAKYVASLLKADITLLHVTSRPVPAEGYLPPDLYQDVVRGGRRWAEEALEALAKGAAARALDVTTRLETGVPARTIVEVVRQEGADLIVVGTHGRTGAGRVLLGSVADAIVRLAPCPVVTVRASAAGSAPRVPRLARICYATDFSPVARRAWPSVATLARVTGAHVDVVHVTFEAVPDRHLSAEAVSAMARVLRERGEADAERFLQDSPLPRDRVRVLIGSGVVGDQIVHLARERSADLIAIGTHGWSGLLRWMLGSVAHHVIQAAPCPVLTVGPEGAEGGAS